VRKSEFDILLVNAPGSFASICSAIKNSGAKILAYALTPIDSSGILQLVTDDETKMRKALRNSNLHFIESDVLVLEDVNSPKDMYEISSKLAQKKININFSYSGCNGIMVFEVDDIDKALYLLSE